jgi:uncharacterized protein YjbI with pentapeptide repeats
MSENFELNNTLTGALREQQRRRLLLIVDPLSQVFTNIKSNRILLEEQLITVTKSTLEPSQSQTTEAVLRPVLLQNLDLTDNVDYVASKNIKSIINCTGSLADFGGSVFSEIPSIETTQLSDSNFENIVFAQGCFNDVELRACNFDNSNLRKLKIYGNTKLVACKFENCDLRGFNSVSLNTDISQCSFRFSDLTDANYYTTIYIEDIDLRSCNLYNAVLEFNFDHKYMLPNYLEGAFANENTYIGKTRVTEQFCKKNGMIWCNSNQTNQILNPELYLKYLDRYQLPVKDIESKRKGFLGMFK